MGKCENMFDTTNVSECGDGRTDGRVQLLTEGDKRMRVFMAEFRVTEKQIYSVSSVGRFPSLLRGFPGPTGPWVSAGIKNQPRRRTPCSEVNQGPTSEDEPQHDKHPAVETQISRIKPITGNSKLWRAVQNDTLERQHANSSEPITVKSQVLRLLTGELRPTAPTSQPQSE